MTGPRRPELTKKILRELRKHPEGIWIRKLARILNEPIMTVHKYVTRENSGYPGKFIEIIEELPTERGGNIIIRLKKKIKMKVLIKSKQNFKRRLKYQKRKKIKLTRS